MRVILASTSPRRREILELLGLPFEVVAPEFDEITSPDSSIAEEVLEFAVGKATSVASAYPGSIVIGSDTMIGIDGEKIGKPVDETDARRILRLLSGRTHTIYTSVGIVDTSGGSGLQTLATVEVDMHPFKADEIDRYLAASESMDKAGAYSIQGEGRKLIASLRGDYLAAVGMPLKPIADYLQCRGVKSKRDIEVIYRDKGFYNWRTFD
jgi:septum formation protein